MAVNDSEKKSRAILEKQTKQGEEYQGFQEAQGQLLNIQAEQRANLNEQRAISNMEIQQNQTLAQAGEIMAASGGAVGGAMVAAPSQNPKSSTKAILNKFGIGKPGTQKSTKTQQVNNSPQKVSITNNTTTHNNIQVSQPQIPMQQPVIPMKTPGSDTNKFKVWLSNAFAKQNEAAAIRDKEYQKREWALTRSANKMIRKMGDLGKAFADKMNPKNISNMFGDQLKVVMFLMGFTLVANNIGKILTFIDGISVKVSSLVNWFTDNGKIKNVNEFFVKLFGGKPGESGWTAAKELGKEIGSKIKDEFSALLDSRGRAMKAVKFPDINFKDLDISGIISTVGTYLGDLMTAMVSGSEGVKKGLINKIKNEGRYGNLDEGRRGWGKYSSTDNGSKYAKNSSMGDAVMYDSEYKRKFKMSSTDFNSSGNLTNNVGASMKQALRLANIASQQGAGAVNSDEFASGLDALKKSAQGRGGTLVGEEFFSNVGEALGIPTTMQQVKGTLEQRNVRYISVPKTEADWIAEGAGAARGAAKGVAENWISNTVGGGSLGGMFVGNKLSDAEGFSNIKDGNIGEGLSDLTIGELASLTNVTNVMYEGTKGWLKKVTGEDNKIIAVEAGDPRYPESKFPTLMDPSGNPMISTQYYLTPSAINKIEAAAKLSTGNQQFSFDFNIQNFKLIDKLLVDHRNKLNKQSAKYKTAVATSGLNKYNEDFNKINELVEQDNFDQSAIDQKYKYGRSDTFKNNISTAYDKAADTVTSVAAPIISAFTSDDSSNTSSNYNFLKGNGTKVGNSNLTLSDFKKCADDLGVDLAIILALRELEVGNKTGFLSDGRPRILFEGHIFWQKLKEKGIKPEDNYLGNEDILYPNWTKSHYSSEKGEWNRLNKAININREAALESASWGMFQIMGFNYNRCNCSSVEDFVKKVSTSDRNQLNLFKNFINNNKHLLSALRKLNFKEIAYYYNGPRYEENKYDIRLRDAYNRIKKYLETVNLQKYEDDNMYSDLAKDVTSQETLYNLFNVNSLSDIDLSNISYNDNFKKYMSEEKFNELKNNEDFSKIKTVNDLTNSNFWKQGIINSDTFIKNLETTHKNLKAPEKEKYRSNEEIFDEDLTGYERGVYEHYSTVGFDKNDYLNDVQNIFGDKTREALNLLKTSGLEDILNKDKYRFAGQSQKKNKEFVENILKRSKNLGIDYLKFNNNDELKKYFQILYSQGRRNIPKFDINNESNISSISNFLNDEVAKTAYDRAIKKEKERVDKNNDDNYANWDKKHSMAKLVSSITGNIGINSGGAINWGNSINEAIEFGLQNPNSRVASILKRAGYGYNTITGSRFDSTTGKIIIDPKLKSNLMDQFMNASDDTKFELLHAYQEDLSGISMDDRTRNLHILTKEAFSNRITKDTSILRIKNNEENKGKTWLEFFENNSGYINEIEKNIGLKPATLSASQAADLMEKGSISDTWKKYSTTIETSSGFEAAKAQVSNTLSTLEQVIQPKSQKIPIKKKDGTVVVTLERLNPNGEPNITLNQVAEKLKNDTWDVEGISKAEGELLAQQIDILNKTNNSIVDLSLLLAGIYDNTYITAAVGVTENTPLPESPPISQDNS